MKVEGDDTSRYEDGCEDAAIKYFRRACVDVYDGSMYNAVEYNKKLIKFKV